MPERRYAAAGRQAAIFAAILGVSTGLCGLTAYATRSQQYGGSDGIWLGGLELIGMAVGAIGLVVAALRLLILWIQSFTNKENQ